MQVIVAFHCSDPDVTCTRLIVCSLVGGFEKSRGARSGSGFGEVQPPEWHCEAREAASQGIGRWFECQ